MAEQKKKSLNVGGGNCTELLRVSVGERVSVFSMCVCGRDFHSHRQHCACILVQRR